MTVNASRHEMRLGDSPERTVRVGVAVEMLRQSAHDSSRRILCQAAIRAFRERAVFAGFAADAIEAEVDRFSEAVARLDAAARVAA